VVKARAGSSAARLLEMADLCGTVHICSYMPQCRNTKAHHGPVTCTVTYVPANCTLWPVFLRLCGCHLKAHKSTRGGARGQQRHWLCLSSPAAPTSPRAHRCRLRIANKARKQCTSLPAARKPASRSQPKKRAPVNPTLCGPASILPFTTKLSRSV
jgi:hypothetical protein